MEIAVRNITPDDFAALWEMEWWPLVKERDSIYLEICLQQSEFSFITGAGDGGVAGAVLAGRGSESAFIYHIWVDPDFRGRGLGTELVRHVERAASRAGLGFVWLFTSGAVGFYERLGYEPDGSIFSGTALDHIVQRKKVEVMVKQL